MNIEYRILSHYYLIIYDPLPKPSPKREGKNISPLGEIRKGVSWSN
jgi:hypothetical protein